MLIKQLSVFVENQPGRLAEITDVLGKNDIDIRALCIADTTDFGILRLIVNHPGRAERELKAAGFTVTQTKVLGIGIEDTPGGLAKPLEVLKDNGITIEYMYAFLSQTTGTAHVILRVEETERAKELLEAAQVSVLCGEDIN